MTTPQEDAMSWISRFMDWLKRNPAPTPPPTPTPVPPDPTPVPPDPTPVPPKPTTGSKYDAAVLANKPVLFLASFSDSGSGDHSVRPVGTPGSAKLPNGESAFLFNGKNYLEVASAADLSVPTTKSLTIEAWIRPDVLTFADAESSGYVHWMGKGESGKHEWVCRMYQLNNSESRPNRISGYAFNASGGIGNGSYFQDKVTVGEWIFYTLVLTTVSSSSYPQGYVKIFKNGVQRDQDPLDSSGGANIKPSAGNAPMRVGTRDMQSFFQGAIGKVAVFPTELSAAQIKAHYNAMAAT